MTTIQPTPLDRPLPVARSPGPAAMTNLIGPGCPSLTVALAQARDKCKGASKDGTNTFHGYKYASADEVIATASEALNGSGLGLIPFRQKLGILGSGNYAVYTLDRVVLLSHSSGEYVPLEIEGWPVIPDKGRPLDKAFAIALTSSLAYVLRDLLQMPRGDQYDVDARDDRQVVALDVNGQPAPATESPSPSHDRVPQASQDTTPTITPEQRSILVNLCYQKGRAASDLSSMLESRGLTDLDLLPQALMPWALGILTDGQAETAQIDRIAKLAEARKIPWVGISARLQAKFGVDRLRLLTRSQADQIEKALAAPIRPKPAPAA